MTDWIVNPDQGFITNESDPFRASQMIREVLEPVFADEYQKLFLSVFHASNVSYWKDHEPSKVSSYSIDWTQHSGRSINDLHDQLYRAIFEARNPRMLHRKHIRWTMPNVSSPGVLTYTALLIPNKTPKGNLLLHLSSYWPGYRQALLESELVRPYDYWDDNDPSKRSGATPDVHQLNGRRDEPLGESEPPLHLRKLDLLSPSLISRNPSAGLPSRWKSQTKCSARHGQTGTKTQRRTEKPRWVG